ncbi:helix-turn-helix transcriptional regulator, partial [Micromonospora sp. NPDC049799]|uniref:helix-turn-helix domain-containing protein n=1 Tax=Micromonospora sp. NPDC049799 TaxID=3154741 RepID=UPI0034006542
MSLLRRVIGGVLRRLRQRQGRTLREVAAAAGVSVPYLSEVERGRKEASSEVLAAICRALGIRLSDLLEEARDDLRRVEPRIPAAPPRPTSDFFTEIRRTGAVPPITPQSRVDAVA